MKAKRLIPIFASFACLILVAVYYQHLVDDIPRAHTSGTHLKVSTLANDEELTASYVFDHRTRFARQYEIRRRNGALSLAIFSASVEWQGTKAVTKADQLLGTHILTPAEQQGLDALIAYFRTRREEHSSAFTQTALIHRRAGKVIGEEIYVGFGLPGSLDYLDQEAKNGAATTHDYDKLAADYGLTRAELDRIVPFERLTRRATGNR
ncbi:MAG: hypothetical protein Q8N18_02405 [Opitutaceae bacterium]|nr:hypothetical protein [Opitutaceae bacterium]